MGNKDFESLESIILDSDYLVQNVVDMIENEDFYIPVAFKYRIFDDSIIK